MAMITQPPRWCLAGSSAPQNKFGHPRHAIVDIAKRLQAICQCPLFKPAEPPEPPLCQCLHGLHEVDRRVAIGTCQGDLLESELADIEPIMAGKEPYVDDDTASASPWMRPPRVALRPDGVDETMLFPAGSPSPGPSVSKPSSEEIVCRLSLVGFSDADLLRPEMAGHQRGREAYGAPADHHDPTGGKRLVQLRDTEPDCMPGHGHGFCQAPRRDGVGLAHRVQAFARRPRPRCGSRGPDPGTAGATPSTRGKPELEADRAHFVLEQRLQRFDQLELQVVGQAARRCGGS